MLIQVFTPEDCTSTGYIGLFRYLGVATAMQDVIHVIHDKWKAYEASGGEQTSQDSSLYTFTDFLIESGEFEEVEEAVDGTVMVGKPRLQKMIDVAHEAVNYVGSANYPERIIQAHKMIQNAIDPNSSYSEFI